MAPLQYAEVFVDASYDAGHGGLTGTGGTVEHEVVADLGVLEALLLALFLQADEVGQRAHLLLHALESDEVVELLVGIAFEGLVDDDGIALLRLLRGLLGGLRGVCGLLVVDEDAHDDDQHEEADGQASTAFETFT